VASYGESATDVVDGTDPDCAYAGSDLLQEVGVFGANERTIITFPYTLILSDGKFRLPGQQGRGKGRDERRSESRFAKTIRICAKQRGRCAKQPGRSPPRPAIAARSKFQPCGQFDTGAAVLWPMVQFLLWVGCLSRMSEEGAEQ
jgi:hypothetical protein